jgi:hypothetical protein
VRALPRDAYPEKLLFVYDKTNVFRKYECPPVFTDDGAKDQTFVANPWGNGSHSYSLVPSSFSDWFWYLYRFTSN